METLIHRANIKKTDSVAKMDIACIGPQIWTSSDYSLDGRQSFCFEEIEIIQPPEGFRFPTVTDWICLFRAASESARDLIVKCYPGGRRQISGDFDRFSALFACEEWKDQLSEGIVVRYGSNASGFNARQTYSSEIHSAVRYYCDCATFCDVYFWGNGIFLNEYDVDPRQEFREFYDSYRYAIRFVKDR